MRQAERNYLEVNGFKMHYRLWGTGKPLLLLHALSGAGSDWSFLFDAPPPGYALIVPDLRGHGYSDNPSGQFSFRQCALDVLALLNALELAEVAAAGLSGGAQTLLHLATIQPHRVSKLVLVSTSPYFTSEARALMAQHSFAAIAPDALEQMRARHAFGDAQIQKLYEIGRSLKDSYDDVAFTPPQLSTIKADTLIVHGDQDPLYRVAVATEMFRAIPNSSLWIVPGGGHLPIFDKAAAFREVILEFLKGRLC